MAAFIYRCPVTGYNVQAVDPDDPIKDLKDVFRPVTCTICGRVHLVNPKTGRALE
jgi:hypothetical protein